MCFKLSISKFVINEFQCFQKLECHWKQRSSQVKPKQTRAMTDCDSLSQEKKAYIMTPWVTSCQEYMEDWIQYTWAKITSAIKWQINPSHIHSLNCYLHTSNESWWESRLLHFIIHMWISLLACHQSMTCEQWCWCCRL